MSATPKPKVRPVTRWMVAYLKPSGHWKFGCSIWDAKDDADGIVRALDARQYARAIRVRITPVTPRKKAKKGAGR